MPIAGAKDRIVGAVAQWEGLTIGPHRFGGTEFLIGKREIGHIHGDHLVDIPFPKRIRDEVVSSGEAQPHHVLPESGWVSLYLREAGDIERALALLRRSYEIAIQQKAARRRTAEGKAENRDAE